MITENTAGHWGGGICCLDNSAPVIASNTIVGNSAGYNGGGIFCDNSSATITGNTIKLNIADYAGGGITCWRSSSIISSNIISRNIAGEQGAGIYCWLSSPIIDSCTISSNNGDGVYCDSLSNPIINHNNITDNADYGIQNVDSTIIINAEYNWWGDTSGPSGFGPGIGDEVSQWVDYDPWLTEPVSGVGEEKIVPVGDIDFGATIISGPLMLPNGRDCKVFDITGRVIAPDKMKPGIYFIEIDGKITRKVVQVR
jgi:parallel beta-helix repeat protein